MLGQYRLNEGAGYEDSVTGTGEKRLFESKLEWREPQGWVWLLALLVCFQSCSIVVLAQIRDSSVPAWDRAILGGAWWWGAATLTVLGLAYGSYLFTRKTSALRAAGAALGGFSLITSPLCASWFLNWFRPSGEVTIDNWKEHRALHESAAMADAVDQHTEDFAVQKRHFRCTDTNLVRFKLVKMDRAGHVRSYVEGTEGIYDESVAWYFDEKGVLRFVWDHGNEQRTFLDAAGNALWSWRRGEYGLHVINSAHLSPRSATDAQVRLATQDPGCQPL